MIGTFLNTAAILIGSIVGLMTRKELSVANQSFLKIAIGAYTVYIGLSLTWTALTGSVWQRLKQLGLVVLALIAGKLAGSLLKLQKASNRVGHFARENLGRDQPGQAPVGNAFLTCSALFCVAPLAFLGAVQEGLTADVRPLAAKALMDGLAAMAFVRMIGWGALLSAIPVFAWQGTLTLATKLAAPFLQHHSLVNGIQATNGLLIFCVALIALELKKIEITNYLPALAVAPLIFWLV